MNEKHYRLRFLPMFEEDLNGIVDYIAHHLHNPIAANNLVDAVERAIQDRLPVCEAFEPYHSTRERVYPYYQISVKNFLIFYVVIDNNMEVRRMFYNRRNWKRII